MCERTELSVGPGMWDKFHVSIGLRQQNSLSALLLTMVVDLISKNVKHGRFIKLRMQAIGP